MEVRTMTEDEDGRIWVGTMDGLMSFDGHFTTPEQIQFETYRQVSENSNVADNDIYVTVDNEVLLEEVFDEFLSLMDEIEGEEE